MSMLGALSPRSRFISFKHSLILVMAVFRSFCLGWGCLCLILLSTGSLALFSSTPTKGQRMTGVVSYLSRSVRTAFARFKKEQTPPSMYTASQGLLFMVVLAILSSA